MLALRLTLWFGWCAALETAPPRPIRTHDSLLQQCEWRRPAATTAAVNIPILTKAAPETVLQMMMMMMMMMIMMAMMMMLVVSVGS